MICSRRQCAPSSEKLVGHKEYFEYLKFIKKKKLFG